MIWEWYHSPHLSLSKKAHFTKWYSIFIYSFSPVSHSGNTLHIYTANPQIVTNFEALPTTKLSFMECNEMQKRFFIKNSKWTRSVWEIMQHYPSTFWLYFTLLAKRILILVSLQYIHSQSINTMLNSIASVNKQPQAKSSIFRLQVKPPFVQDHVWYSIWCWQQLVDFYWQFMMIHNQHNGSELLYKYRTKTEKYTQDETFKSCTCRVLKPSVREIPCFVTEIWRRGGGQVQAGFSERERWKRASKERNVR